MYRTDRMYEIIVIKQIFDWKSIDYLLTRCNATVNNSSNKNY